MSQSRNQEDETEQDFTSGFFEDVLRVCIDVFVALLVVIVYYDGGIKFFKVIS